MSTFTDPQGATDYSSTMTETPLSDAVHNTEDAATPPEPPTEGASLAVADDHVRRAVSIQTSIAEHCDTIEELRQERDHQFYLAATASGHRPAHIWRAVATHMGDGAVSESTVRNAVRDGKRAAARAARHS